MTTICVQNKLGSSSVFPDTLAAIEATSTRIASIISTGVFSTIPQDYFHGTMHIDKVWCDDEKEQVRVSLLDKDSSDKKMIFLLPLTYLTPLITFLAGDAILASEYKAFCDSGRSPGAHTSLMSFIRDGIMWDKLNYLLGKNPQGTDGVRLMDSDAIDALKKFRDLHQGLQTEEISDSMPASSVTP